MQFSLKTPLIKRIYTLLLQASSNYPALLAQFMAQDLGQNTQMLSHFGYSWLRMK
jgi:hypothetical protein